MTQRIPVALILAALLSACGSSSTTMTPPDTRRVSTFSGTLDDPTRCTCAPGALGAFTVQPNASGRLDAVATVQPADAKLVVRLLDPSLNTVHVVSTQTGATATLNFAVAPGTYAIQVFLASDGPRQASYNLSVTYP